MSINSMAPHAAGRTLHLQALCAWPGHHAPVALLGRNLLGLARHSVAALSTRPAALAVVVLPAGGREGFLLHPAAMDSSMHAGVLTAVPDGLLRVPGKQCCMLRKALTMTNVCITSAANANVQAGWMPCTHRNQRASPILAAGQLSAAPRAAGSRARPALRRTGCCQGKQSTAFWLA